MELSTKTTVKKSSTELFSIQSFYFPDHGMGGYGIYLDKNILIDGILYKVKKAKSNRKGIETYSCSVVPLKTESKTEYVVDFEIIPRFGRIHESISGGKQDICQVMVFYRKPCNHEYNMCEESIIFRKDCFTSLLRGERMSIRFSFLREEEKDIDINAEGKVLENKHFSSMDVLIAEKAFDYAFKNIDSFEVTK